MKILPILCLLVGTAIGQEPQPTYVTVPITKSVPKCPDGFTVERWHERPSPVQGGNPWTPIFVRDSGYYPYAEQQPLFVTGDDRSYVHPDRCVANVVPVKAITGHRMECNGAIIDGICTVHLPIKESSVPASGTNYIHERDDKLKDEEMVANLLRKIEEQKQSIAKLESDASYREQRIRELAGSVIELKRINKEALAIGMDCAKFLHEAAEEMGKPITVQHK